MKIAIVIPKHNFSRSTRAAIPQLAYTYAQRSAFRETIHFFCGWVPDPLDPKASILPQTIDIKDIKKAGPLFVDRIRRFQPDIIELHGHIDHAAYLSRAFPHLPFVYCLHIASREQEWYQKTKNFMHIVCVSDFARKFTETNNPKDKAKFAVIKNALPTDGWLAKDSKKENIILFCGRIIPHKGIQEFIEAASAIKSQFPDWRFVVLGRAADRDYYVQQETMFQDALGHQGAWIENALLEQVQTWVKKARLAVVPSNLDEPFGLSLLEQHMASCAVISSGRGGMPEVSGPDGALYLKEVSGNAIAQALRFLINSPQERSALARRGHEYVMRHHRIDDRAAEIDALRNQTLQRFNREKGMWRRIRAQLPF